MAGLAQNTPLPTNIVVHQRSRELGVDFSDGSAFRFRLLPCWPAWR